MRFLPAPECVDCVAGLRVGVGREQCQTVVGHHAVDVAAALVGVDRGNQAVLAYLYLILLMQSLPGAPFIGSASFTLT